MYGPEKPFTNRVIYMLYKDEAAISTLKRSVCPAVLPDEEITASHSRATLDSSVYFHSMAHLCEWLTENTEAGNIKQDILSW